MSEGEPSLYEQTVELGKSLKAVSDRDPAGKPTTIAETAFRSWLNAVGSSTSEPRYFQDVAENYDIEANSNKDLFTVFELLHPYVDLPDYEEEPPKTFIGLTVI
jgi:hypothetical protein